METLPAQLRPVLLQDAPWGLLFDLGVTAAALLLLLIAGLTVALFRLRLRNWVRTRRWTRLEEAWQPLLLDVLHGGGPSDALQDEVTPRDRVFFLRFLVGFAQRLRGQERTTVEELARPHLESLLPELDDADAERRGFAVRTLGVLGIPHHARRLVDALDDPAPLVRFAAAHGLLSEGRADLAEEVVRKLHRFGTWAGDAVAGLLARAGREVAPLLRITLTDPFSPPETAVIAARALRRLGDPHAADGAASVLETRSEREVVTECLRLLGEVGQREQADLVRSFADHPDFAVRAQAMAALGEIGRPADADVLEKGVGDTSAWVRLRAAEGLARMGRFELLEELAARGGEGAVFARQAAEEGG